MNGNGTGHRLAMWVVLVFLGVGVLVNSWVTYQRTELISDYRIHKISDEDKIRNLQNRVNSLELKVESLQSELQGFQSLLVRVALKQGLDPDVVLKNNGRK